MTVAFVTLIFSLSIKLPNEKVTQRDLINTLLEFDFKKYDVFLAKKIDEFSKTTLSKVSQELENKIKNEDLLILNLHHIHEAFKKSAHVGKILIDESILSNTSNTNLNQLDALNGLSLDHNIQLLVPKVDELSEKINLYLNLNHSPGLRIDNVNLSIGDKPFNAQSFLPGNEVFLNLYFELPSGIRMGGAPVFNADFPAEIITLNDTSFMHWILKSAQDKDIVVLDNNEKILMPGKEKKLIWLPNLGNVPNGFKEDKLGLIVKNLSNEIKQSSPKNQKISLFGTTIPGILFVYASPLSLMFLIYYFMNHSRHITTLADINKKDFKQFAWMPLSSGTYWNYESWLSIILLPILSLFTLYYQLFQFGWPGLLPSLIIIVSVIVIFGLGIKSIEKIKLTRSLITEKKETPC